MRAPGPPVAADDRAMIQAFQRVCARLVQVSEGLTAEAVINSSPADSPFHEDIGWIVDRVDTSVAAELGEAYGEHVRNHRSKIAIAADHVRAMKLLSKHMSSGYQVVASHARAVLLAALSLHYFVDAEASSEARVCRFAAHLLEQGSYVGRIGGVIAADMLQEGTGRTAHPQQSTADLLDAAGFDIEYNKKQGFVQAVTWGETRAAVKWVPSRAARDLGASSEFAWFLTSGAAHVEPWATNNFNVGKVDFYGTMAQASLMPAFHSMAEDVGGYFGVDTASHVRRMEEVESALVSVMIPILDRVVTELPEDDPFGQMLRRGRDHRLRLESLLNYLSETVGVEGAAVGDADPGSSNDR